MWEPGVLIELLPPSGSLWAFKQFLAFSGPQCAHLYNGELGWGMSEGRTMASLDSGWTDWPVPCLPASKRHADLALLPRL